MKALALFQIQLKDILKNLQVCLLFFVFPVIGFVMSSSMQDQSSFFISVFATMHVVFTPMMTMSTILAEQKEQKIIRNLAYAGVPSSLYLLVHGVLVCFLTCFTACLFLVFPGFSLDVIPFLTAVFTGVILSILLGGCIALSTSSLSSSNAVVMPFAMLFSFVPMLANFNEHLDNISNILYSKQVSIKMNDLHQINLLSSLILVFTALLLIIWFYLAYHKSMKADV